MMLLKAGGALAFIAAMGVSDTRLEAGLIECKEIYHPFSSRHQGWYLFIALVLSSVGFPFNLPNPDLSSRIFPAKHRSAA